MNIKNAKLSKAVLLALFVTAGVHAQPQGHEDATSEDVTFSATVEEQCGIDVTVANANLAFGDAYNDSKAQVKLINNEEDGSIKLKLEPIKPHEIGDDIKKEDVWFQSGGVHQANMNASDWEDGIDYSRDDIRSNNLVDLSARINIDESNMDADDYALVTNWVIECD